MTHRLRVACCTIAALLLPMGSAVGQEWIVAASAGSTDYAGAATVVGTRHAMLGVHRDGTTWMYLTGGAPLDSVGFPWVAGGVGSRASTALASLDVGIDLGGQGFAYREFDRAVSGSGLIFSGLPYVGYARGAGRVEVRAGVLHHRWALGDSTGSRSVRDSGVRGWYALPSGALFAAEGRLVGSDEGSYPFVGGTLDWPVGRFAITLRGGRWLADSFDQGEWGVAARMKLQRRFTIRAAYRRDADDPLFWNGSRRGWTIGLSRSLGARTRPDPLEPITVAVPKNGGSVLIRLPLEEESSAPSIAGDFNGWQPAPMHRGGGAWEAHLTLPPGVYHYSFVDPSGRWYVPESIPNRIDDGFGGVNALLVVTGR